MGKKKRKSAKKPSRVKKTTLKKRHPSPAKKKLVITIIGGAFLLLLVLFLFYSNFGFNSDLLNSGSSENNPGTQSKRKSLLPSRSPGEEIKAPKTHFEDFAGSESCKECHEKEYNLWINSTHGKAGGEPGNVEIIAKFDGNPLVFKDAVVTPKITPNGEYVFIVEQDNRPTRIIRVDAVVGGGHMYGGGTQSFFTKLPDGTIRFLPFDFIRDENLWFVQLQEGKEWTPVSKEISLNDLAHWTPHRILGTMEGTSNCQNCHGSQILLEYLPEKKRYRTRFRTLKINCEACHGPSKRHNELARLENHEELEDLDMAALATFTKDSSLNVCFQCHSTKDMLQDEYLSGDNQNEYYSLNLPILGSEPYLPDGRIRSFAYQRNHVFSDCYVNGSMTCVDCHDPHTQNYRDIVGNPLEGRFDNGQCTGCHASKARNPELHTFHKPDSTGNLCVGCHMPYLQHQAVGAELDFARSDHVIPIPRPAFDTQLGIEDACSKCHPDKSVEWLQAKTEEWYGELKPHNPIISDIMKAENVRNINKAAELLLQTESNHVVAKITGLSHFIKRFLKPDMYYLDPKIVDKLKQLSESDNIDLKAFSLMSLHLALDQNPEIHDYLVNELQNLKKRERAVRYRWALAADFLGTRYASKGAFTDAIKAHKKALEIKPEDAFTWLNLGTAYRQMRDYKNAIDSYKRAAEIKPYLTDIHFRLAEVYSITGDREAAIRWLKNVLKYDPGNQRARQILRRLEKF